jgi:hypothetical protein
MPLETLQNQNTFGINASDRKCVFLLALHLCTGVVTLRQATSCAGNTRSNGWRFSNKVFTVFCPTCTKIGVCRPITLNFKYQQVRAT